MRFLNFLKIFDNSWIFGFLWVFLIIQDFFLDFLDLFLIFFGVSGFFVELLDFLKFFETCWIFFWGGAGVFLEFLSKLLRLLPKVTKVITRHKTLPKMGQNRIIRSFFPQGQKKPLPKPSVGA